MEKTVTVFPYDTMGLARLLPDYVVETTFTAMDEGSTKREITHFYSGSMLSDTDQVEKGGGEGSSETACHRGMRRFMSGS